MHDESRQVIEQMHVIDTPTTVAPGAAAVSDSITPRTN